VFGGKGPDEVSGYNGDDHLDGGPQHDRGFGGRGDDTCIRLEVRPLHDCE
jgi:Ca2+-binding RTX toxin-like protein